MKSLRNILVLLTCLFAISGYGQVPQLLNYQGRVSVGTTNFDGAGSFKFALVNSNGTVTFWSNDGTSAGGSQPAAAVSLTVVRGLYSVLLGDTTLGGMTLALPSSVFTNFDVRLRVWFNDGVTGFQQFTPDQRIAAVGYALMGANVPDGAITSNKLAVGSVTATKIADGSVTSSKLAPNTVTSSNIADTIALGQTNVSGRLDVYRTSANTPAISLVGSSSAISTYGSDGLEQVRIHGTSYGEIILHNSLSNNAAAVTLSAQGTIGGQLSLNNTNGLVRALLEGENTGGQLTLYQADGNTGAFLDGDSGGSGYLSLRGTNGLSRAVMDASDGGGGALRLYESDGTETATLTAQNNGVLVLRQGDGTAGLGISANNGTGGGGLSIYNDVGAYVAQLTVGSTSRRFGYLGLAGSNSVNRLYAQVWNGVTQSAYIGMVNSAGSQTITLDSDASGDGRITTQVLQITGGADLSENFDIKTMHDELKAGMIVSIDPEKPGQLVMSRNSYDKTVAGIISGAGGVKTGMLMGQKGTEADGKHPVALTGRVYCYVDADAGGAIEPGDLLTTSPTPGHGMKVTDHTKATGAIIGKAMGKLASGKGLVLVLVSLQ
jgi:hypothetical protein